MGGHDKKGREYHIRGVMYHTLSPFELSVWKGLKFSLSTWPRRINATYFYYIPFVLGSYVVIDWMEKENARSHRKIPSQFDKDV